MKTLKFAAALAMAAASTVAFAQPAIDFGSFASTQIVGSDPLLEQAFPRVAINPAGTQFALFFVEGTDLVLQVRQVSDASLLASATINAATSGWNADGELAVAFDPTGANVYVGWGVGADEGVSIASHSASTGTINGSIVVVSALIGNKPKFDFFSDGSVLVAYEGNDGPGNLGGAVMRRYDAALTPIGGEVIIHDTNNLGAQGDAAIGIIRTGTLATDIVVTAWEDEANTRFPAALPGTEDDVNYRLFDSTLAPLTALTGVPAAQLATSGGPDENDKMGNPAIGIADDGSFMIGWEGEFTAAGGDERVFGAFFDSSQTALSSDATIVSTPALAGRQQGVFIAYNATVAHYLAFFQSRGSTTVQLRFFSKTGVPSGSEVTLNGDLPTTSARYGSMALSGNVGIAAWQDVISGADNAYYRLFQVTGSTNVSDWVMFN